MKCYLTKYVIMGFLASIIGFSCPTFAASPQTPEELEVKLKQEENKWQNSNTRETVEAAIKEHDEAIHQFLLNPAPFPCEVSENKNHCVIDWLLSQQKVNEIETYAFEILSRGTESQVNEAAKILSQGAIYAQRYSPDKRNQLSNKDVLKHYVLALMFAGGLTEEAIAIVRKYYGDALRREPPTDDPLYRSIYALTDAGKLNAAIELVKQAQELWVYRDKIYTEKKLSGVMCMDCRRADDPVTDLVKALILAGEPTKAKDVACKYDAEESNNSKGCNREVISIYDFYAKEGAEIHSPAFVSSESAYARQRLTKQASKLNKEDSAQLLLLLENYLLAEDVKGFEGALSRLKLVDYNELNRRYGWSYRPSKPAYSRLMQGLISKPDFSKFLSVVWPYYLSSCVGEYGQCVEKHCGSDGTEPLPKVESVYALCLGGTLNATSLEYGGSRREEFYHRYPWPPTKKK